MHDLRLIEERSLTALPALQTVYDDGWVLRFAGGYTRRANSVQALYPPLLPLDEKIARCEAFYARCGQPAVFKLTHAPLPADLDAQLEARGYTASPTTSVQIAALNGNTPAADVIICPELSDDWLNAYYHMNAIPPQHQPTMRAMLQNIVPAAGYASIEQDGQPVAVGLAVADGAYAGFFDIVVAAAARRNGIGQRLMRGLMAWSRAQGAQYGYLQVVSDNLPARALYHKLGFEECYTYWYRQQRG